MGALWNSFPQAWSTDKLTKKVEELEKNLREANDVIKTLKPKIFVLLTQEKRNADQKLDLQEKKIETLTQKLRNEEETRNRLEDVNAEQSIRLHNTSSQLEDLKTIQSGLVARLSNVGSQTGSMRDGMEMAVNAYQGLIRASTEAQEHLHLVQEELIHTRSALRDTQEQLAEQREKYDSLIDFPFPFDSQLCEAEESRQQAIEDLRSLVDGGDKKSVLRLFGARQASFMTDEEVNEFLQGLEPPNFDAELSPPRSDEGSHHSVDTDNWNLTPPKNAPLREEGARKSFEIQLAPTRVTRNFENDANDQPEEMSPAMEAAFMASPTKSLGNRRGAIQIGPSGHQAKPPALAKQVTDPCINEESTTHRA